MELFTTEQEYLIEGAKMKEPYDVVHFKLEYVSFDEVLDAIRIQYPNHKKLALYQHANTISIQQTGGKCGMGSRGIKV